MSQSNFADYVSHGAAVLGTALLMSASAHAADLDKVHFQWSWIPTGEYAPISAGMEKGFYEEAGIDLSVSTGRGSGDAVKKVAGGGGDFGDGDIAAVMAARVRNNAPVKCIMSEHTHSPHAFFVLESSGINSVKDLKGKKLVTTPGNSHFLYFPLVAKKGGLNPDDVEWLMADATPMGALLMTKQVDSAPMFATHEYVQGKQAAKLGEKIKVLPYADYGFEIYSYCIYATEATLAEKPDMVRRFVEATLRSFHWAKEHPEEAAEIHNARFSEVAKDDALGALTVMNDYFFNERSDKVGFGCYDDAQLANSYKVVAEAQDLDPNYDYKQIVTEEFMPHCN